MVNDPVIDRDYDGEAVPYRESAWWLLETGCPMDSIVCDSCCKAQIDAAWKRHDDKVRATRMDDESIRRTIELEGAMVCDFCGTECVR